MNVHTGISMEMNIFVVCCVFNRDNVHLLNAEQTQSPQPHYKRVTLHAGRHIKQQRTYQTNKA